MSLATRLTTLATLSLFSVSAAQASWQERGNASWYGAYHQGRRSSDGSLFDAQAMTAAHTSLPLGSVVRVTSETTGQSVIVTITDRLPPKRTRVIDLSRGAAARIGLVAMGVGPVTLVRADGAVADDDAEEETVVRPARYARSVLRRAHPMIGLVRPSVVRIRGVVSRHAGSHTL